MARAAPFRQTRRVAQLQRAAGRTTRWQSATAAAAAAEAMACRQQFANVDDDELTREERERQFAGQPVGRLKADEERILCLLKLLPRTSVFLPVALLEEDDDDDEDDDVFVKLAPP